MTKKLTTITQISPRILGFLTHLEANNNKAWMDERRDFYQESKYEVLSFGQTLTNELVKINPDFEYVVIRKCIFRINRDIRFARYKIPYKPRFALHIAPWGTKSDYAGIYLHLQPGGKSIMAWGHYSVWWDYRKLMRKHIIENTKQLTSILNNPQLKKTFGSLQGKKRSKLPRWVEKTDLAAKYLKQDSRYLYRSYSDEQVTSEWFIDLIKSDYLNLKPFNDFCNGIIDLQSIITQS